MTPSLVSEWMDNGTLHVFMRTIARCSVETYTMVCESVRFCRRSYATRTKIDNIVELLAIRNCFTGLDIYLIRKGYRARAQAFCRFTVSIRARFEIANSECAELGSWNDYFDLLVGRFISSIWRSLTCREASEHETFLQDQEEQSVWAQIYTIYFASRRYSD